MTRSVFRAIGLGTGRLGLMSRVWIAGKTALMHMRGVGPDGPATRVVEAKRTDEALSTGR